MCKPLAGHIEDPLDWRASSFDPLAPIVRTEFNGHWSGFSTCQHQSLDFQGFPPRSIKNLKNWCFLPFTLSGPLSKQTVIVCGFGGFRSRALCVSRFVAFELKPVRSRVFESFTSALGFLSSLYWNMASSDCSFQIQKKHGYGRVKTNLYVPVNIYRLQLLLVTSQTEWMLR